MTETTQPPGEGASGAPPAPGDQVSGTPTPAPPPADAVLTDTTTDDDEPTSPPPSLPVPEGVTEEPVIDTTDDAEERPYEEAHMPDADEKHHGYTEDPPRSFAERTLEEKPGVQEKEGGADTRPPAAPGKVVKRG